LFVDLAEFACFYQLLHYVIIKIVLQIKTKQFYDHIMQKQGNSAKSTNNPMSSFGLSEENMEVSPIY
jgi:hypothetical protein